MAQTGYTPILIYSSSTGGNAPAAGSLTNSTLGSELAINITDGKLFYKDNANAIQVIGWKVVPATAGGTGQTSYAVGDILYADTTTSLAKLADVATGNALISGGVGVAPSWGKIGLTTHVTGTLPVANGGTGTATAFTAGSIVFAGASGVYSQNNANLFWDATNLRLGIGTASPTNNVDVLGATTTQVRVRMTGQADMRFAADTGTGFLGTSNSFPVGIRTNNTTGIYIDTSQNVGIGGIAPSVRLDVNSASTTQLRVQMTGQPDVRLISDTGYGAVGTYSNAQFLIRTNSTTAATVDTSQNITFNSGNLIQGTAAKGINFTANTPAAGMTSQLLNWYEQGTWTPVIAGATTPGTQTYSIQVGRYTRIGNRVFYNCRIVMTAKDAATSGTLYVGGLPFTSNNTASNFSPAAVSNAGNIDLTAGYTQISAEVQPNGTVVYLGQIGDNVAFSLLTDTALTNTTRIALSGNYEV